MLPENAGLPALSRSWSAFALADRVVAEDGQPVLGHQDADALIRFAGLARRLVSARDEHAGKRRLALGDVEHRGDMMSRPALVDDPLDAIAVASVRADDARVERCFLGKLAQQLPEFGAKAGGSLGDVLGSLDAATAARRA